MNTTLSAKPSKANPTRTCAKSPRHSDRQFNRLMRLMAREDGRAIYFSYDAERDSKVYVAGTFNNWNPTTHPLNHHPEDGVFKAALLLPPGVHEYKFVVNGRWHVDTRWPSCVPNDCGTLNNVVRV